MGKTYLDESIVQTDGGKEGNTLLLGSGGEGDRGLVTGSLVGDEKGGDVKGTSLSRGGGRGSGGGHHVLDGSASIVGKLRAERKRGEMILIGDKVSSPWDDIVRVRGGRTG